MYVRRAALLLLHAAYRDQVPGEGFCVCGSASRSHLRRTYYLASIIILPVDAAQVRTAVGPGVDERFDTPMVLHTDTARQTTRLIIVQSTWSGTRYLGWCSAAGVLVRTGSTEELGRSNRPSFFTSSRCWVFVSERASLRANSEEWR